MPQQVNLGFNYMNLTKIALFVCLRCNIGDDFQRVLPQERAARDVVRVC